MSVILLVGGAGFIGRNLTEHLVERGRSCVILDNDSGLSKMRPLPPGARLIQADVTDIPSLKLPTIGSVYYLAGHVGGIGYNNSHQEEMYELNRRAALGLNACYDLNPRQVVYFSTACVYPSSAPVPTPVAFGMKGDPEPSNEGYGTAKREAEELVVSLQRRTRIPTLIVRPFNAYGPWDFFDPDWGHFIPALLWKMLRRPRFVDVWGGPQTRSFVYVKDVVRYVTLLADRCEGMLTVNVGHSTEATIAETAELIRTATGYGGRIKFVDGPIGYWRRAADEGDQKRIVGDFSWTSLREGLAKTIDWCRWVGLENLPGVRSAPARRVPSPRESLRDIHSRVLSCHIGSQPQDISLPTAPP